MRSIPILFLLAITLVGCKTTDTRNFAGNPVAIIQGMPVSEVISVIGEPESVKTGIAVGKLKMDKWHYEVELSRTMDYAEIDTYIEPSSENFQAIRPQKMVDEEGIETIMIETTRTQIMDILVYDDRVFAVQSEVIITRDEEDWSDR